MQEARQSMAGAGMPERRSFSTGHPPEYRQHIPMKSIQHLLVGSDFSSSSDSAIREGYRIASRVGARLSIIHVVNREELRSFASSNRADPDIILHGVTERLENSVRDLIGGPSEMVRCEILVGNPFMEIAGAVTDWNCDLVLLGSRGYGGDEPGRVGTVASKCVRRLPCPVLLLRGRHQHAFRKIVACVDFSENSREALRHAFQLARTDGASLEVLHVDPSRHHIMTDFGSFSLSHTVPSEEALQNARKALESFVRTVGDDHIADLAYTTCIMEGAPVAQTIARHLRDRDADLAVVGTQGRGRLLTVFLGTTAEALIHDSPCSILAVKPAKITDDLEAAETQTETDALEEIRAATKQPAR
jgi:nucleotide-binding universal stress UspA family protein